MSDEELLKKYKSYKKKRNMIIIIISLLLILSIIIVVKFPKVEDKPSTKDLSDEVVEKDNVVPILELTKEEEQIELGSEFDYKKYIKIATDNVDGDLKDSVMYNKVDTTKLGTYEIVYYVFDSSNNMTQKILKLVIKEKKIEIEESSNKQESTSTSSNNSEIKNNFKNETTIKPKEPMIKYFMFEDGYNMGNVVETCAEELKKSGRAGRCIPVTDDNGIYLGMKLEIN